MSAQTHTDAQAQESAGGSIDRSRVGSLVVAAVSLVVVLLTAWFYLRVFKPVQFVMLPEAYRAYDVGPMQRAVAPERVRARLDTLMGFGSRLLGQPGMYKTEDYVRNAYKAAGLEVYEHEIQVASPVTAYREIYQVTGDSGYGKRLGDVEVYPFMPNYLQPVVTPDTGIVGELILLDREALRSRSRFDNCIGLIDSRDGHYDEAYGFAWTRYANLGLKALVVSDADGLDAAPWHIIARRFGGLVADVPVNFVRVAATQGIFDHVGQTIRLRVRVDFKQVHDVALYGVLRAPKRAKEAMFVTAPYDVKSIVPDLAISPMQTSWLALELQVIEGLVAYRQSLQRDVIFSAFGASMMGEDDLNALIGVLADNAQTSESNRLLAALGMVRKDQSGQRMKLVRAEIASNDSLQRFVVKVRALLENPSFLVDVAVTRSEIDKLSRAEAAFLEEQFRYVLNTLVLEMSEPTLQAKVAFERDPSRGTDCEAFRRYLAAKRAYDKASSAAGYSAVSLIRTKREYVQAQDVRGRFQARLGELRDFHAQEARRIEQEKKLVELINPYENIAAFELRTMPSLGDAEREETVTFDLTDNLHEAAVPTISNVVSSALARLGLDQRITYVAPSVDQSQSVNNNQDLWPFPSIAMWSNYGYAAYAFTNLGRTETFRHLGDPVDRPAGRDMEPLRNTFSLVGESLVSLAHGNGVFRPVTIREWRNRTFLGRVLVSNVGQSIVPNYPLKGALVAGRPYEEKAMYGFPGIYPCPVIFADPYGRYIHRNCASDFPNTWRMWAFGYSPVAVGFGSDGLIRYMKDEGEEGQRLFKSVGLAAFWKGPVTIVTFRAAPVSVLDLTNPQTMKDYTGIDMLDPKGLTRFEERCPFWDKGIQTMFLKPDARFYAALQSGAPNNELVKMTRAFMLGITDPERFTSEKEIDGPGYLVADNYVMRNVADEVARSMAWVNGQRLKLQNAYAMADDQTNGYQATTLSRLAESRKPGLSQRLSWLLARDAVTYATLNHPVLRESIFEAVMGILWYLALLVPFVFFFEKLLFCNTDVRRQIAAQMVIFLTVFILLRLLHPAFQMVRSSLMILLGFIIILISGGITILFSGKFQENLADLRKKQGKVAAAEVNRMGVVMSAFMLGLNNMHRRKMRTGLTCATLTLLTFVMICFTSVQNTVVDENVAVGKAAYQGMQIARERLMPISEGEVFALRDKYGDRYGVTSRRMLIGGEDGATKKRANPRLEAWCETGGVARRYKLSSAVLMNYNDPLRSQIRMLSKPRWFTADEDRECSQICPVLIPDRMADNLGISVQDANQEQTLVSINGTQFRVVGIFEARSLGEARDLDGRTILPPDVENLREIVVVSVNAAAMITAQDEDPRIDPANIVITPVRGVFKNVNNSSERIVSASVVMEGTGYREARRDIETFLEQTGQRIYYGLDGIASRGRRARATTMAGLVDLLIPLLIAGLTVVNTMRGSVYERREEIFVYNAVGIAPRYVFFMFIAEAFVYAVVGSVLGYLLSQGTGRILTILNLTGGLNMTFASLATIYASLTIAGAVFVSTYFPARSAMEIAAPAEESGWTLPEPDGDDLEFDLPFNFSVHGRIAVLAFFDRYLRDNGEGSAGRFFAGDPLIGLAPDEDEGGDGGYIPQIATTIWLKPFDLAVCQNMTIMMPPDPETGQYKAHIRLERVSGTREAWMRLNHGFVALVRRHFLHWRAVSNQEREEMFQEAKRMLTSVYQKPLTAAPVA